MKIKVVCPNCQTKQYISTDSSVFACWKCEYVEKLSLD